MTFFLIVIFVVTFVIVFILREKSSINKHKKNQNYIPKSQDKANKNR